jgi:hypothetical protein
LKLCPNCDQSVAEEITICPSCGNQVGDGRKYIDDYRIVDVLHEGHASFLCRAIRQRTAEMVMIRLFTPESGVDEAAAARLRRELDELKKLPDEGFVRHYAIRQAPDGLWYRISEWLDTESWGSLLASERLSDRRVLFDLFHQMASALSLLHQEGYFIPHLILNDIIPINGDGKGLQVKIDYKLFRFFDPKLDRPGPMLKRLLRCHPDITNQRPLDFRSDIWSLGKVFVELLTADLESTDFISKIEGLKLPREAEVLLKVMLADDPDLRPRSMAEVADSLARIRDREMANGEVQVPQVAMASKEEKPEIPITAGQPKRGLGKWFGLSATLLLLLAIAGYLAFFQPGERKEDAATALEGFANQYAPSVAFLLVEYWLEVEGEKTYHNVAEGTAFLVDAEGYMLTSRHVVCPWMEDMGLYATVQQYQINNISPRFGYRLFLWFEGAKAFNRVAAVMEAPDLSDVYFVEDAFSSESKPGVSIAGIPKTPTQRSQIVASPVQDDYAVLKIDRVPDGLIPLPLDTAMDSESVPKLSRFITLGFPLGSRTQEATVNVSVTTGHVRRAFENMLQVDGSIHKGNSGGPIIDTRGKVIGIVSGVALDWAQGLVPMITPRWDMGMVLPITRVAEFLGEIRTGQVKWNGVLDFSVEETVKKISEAAMQGRWAEAQVLADKELESSIQPSLVMAAGVMHFCTRDLQGARRLFSESLSMDAENNDAKLMLSIIDWLVNGKAASTHRQDLLASDWRSPAEFHGYLVRVLDGVTSEDSALKAWYTEAEKSWLYYVVGLARAKRRDWRGSEKVLQEAVLAADVDAWEFVLARSKLEEVQKRRRESLKTEKEWADYNANLELFNQAVQKAQEEKKNRENELGPLRAKLVEETATMKDKLQVLEKIQELYPKNRNIALALAFYSAADESWPQALEHIGAVLKEEGRQNSDRMSLGLLKAGILHYQGHEDEARASLEAFVRQTRDPWYLAISEYLLGKQTLDALMKGAGKSPENLISAYTPLGFWAEGSGDKKRAIKHYKLALESYLDSWIEYDFARERLKKLKKPP